MTLRELQYLVALAENGHFGRAAEVCHVSQPTLSTQLKKLEDYLGVTLFERNNKSLHITKVGEQVIARARKVLAEADAIIDLVRTDTAPLTGRLHLGVIPTLSPYLLPWLVPAVQSAYPRLQLIIHEDMTDPLLEHLKEHIIDTALVVLPTDQQCLESLPLFNEPFFFACPKGHPLASEESITDAHLRNERLLLLTDGHCLRKQALAVCGLADEAPRGRADFRATSLETIRQLVAAGMGCTLLPAMTLGNPVDEHIAIRPLAKDASRCIGLAWRASYPKVAELKLFAGLIRDRLPESVKLA